MRTEKIVDLIRKAQNKGEPITIRELAAKLRTTQKATLTACEDLDLDINVAIGISGAGHHEFENIGDYTVEDLSAD